MQLGVAIQIDGVTGLRQWRDRRGEIADDELCCADEARNPSWGGRL